MARIGNWMRRKLWARVGNIVVGIGVTRQGALLPGGAKMPASITPGNAATLSDPRSLAGGSTSLQFYFLSFRGQEALTELPLTLPFHLGKETIVVLWIVVRQREPFHPGT